MAFAAGNVVSVIRSQTWVGLARQVGLLITLGLVLMSTGAEAARWRGDDIVVRDYTGGRRWGPIIAAQVDALNAALPPGAPRFVYQDAGPLPCHEIRHAKRAISVCAQEHLLLPAETWTTRRDETLVAATIVLRQDQIRLGGNRVCHELMHATTAIADAYQTEPQSCVRGTLPTFGAWDVGLLASEYGQKRR
jgi:hypothetical protein